MRRPTLIAALVVYAAWTSGAFAQTPEAAPEPKPSGETSMEDLLARVQQKDFASFNLTSDCTSFEDATTQERCWKAYVAYFDYYQFGFAHRKTVFWWQHFSSRIIFVVALGLVTVGVLFAWLQFRRDLTVAGTEEAAERESRVHHVEIGHSGLRISSPVLGVIILMISLAFFYLYLVHVYPIVEIL
jgi:hypothetical protein